MDAPTRPGARRAGWRWRRSPLRRPCDVVEAWTRLVMLTVLLVVVPSAGVWTGVSLYDTARSEADRQRAAHHVVRATVVRSAPDPSAAYGTGRTAHRVAVRWTSPDGTPRVAVVRVAAGTPAGGGTDVWLDASENVVEAPSTGAELWTVAIGTGWVTAVGGCLPVAGIWWALRAAARRRRTAEWERDWARTEPLWSGRRA